jgi:hypothetical protein
MSFPLRFKSFQIKIIPAFSKPIFYIRSGPTASFFDLKQGPFQGMGSICNGRKLSLPSIIFHMPSCTKLILVCSKLVWVGEVWIWENDVPGHQIWVHLWVALINPGSDKSRMERITRRIRRVFGNNTTFWNYWLNMMFSSIIHAPGSLPKHTWHVRRISYVLGVDQDTHIEKPISAQTKNCFMIELYSILLSSIKNGKTQRIVHP